MAGLINIMFEYNYKVKESIFNDMKKLIDNENKIKNEKKISIKFGTDGFRGVISKDFTFEAVEIVALAVCDYIYSNGLNLKTAVFFDRRFLSDRFARRIADIFAGYSITVDMAGGPLPTPALSYYIKKTGASPGIMITASHNSFEYNGIKIKTSDGSSAPASVILEIQKRVDSIIANGFDHEKFIETYLIKKTASVNIIDPSTDYLDNISKSVDMEILKKASGRFLINPMFGSQAGFFGRFVNEYGLKIDYDEIFSEHNPLFPGFNPEPIASNLVKMSEIMADRSREQKYAAGFCFDGDGDRIGAMTSEGVFVSPQIIFALLARHIVKNKKKTGGIVKTVSVTSILSKIAEKHGMPLYETPIGFKYIAELMLDKSKNIIIGGEESGGIGINTYIPERDGLFLALCLLEVMAFENKPLELIIEDMFKEYGRYVYDRKDFKFDETKFNNIKEKLVNKKLCNICGFNVVSCSDRDGYKYFLNDGSWILFRFSGTEPVLRIYAEAPVIDRKDENKAASLLNFAEKYLEI